MLETEKLSVTNFVDDKKIAAIQNALNNIPPNEGIEIYKRCYVQ